MRGQEIFNPINFGFHWHDDENWYSWDRKEGHRLAMKARNARLKELRASGQSARAFSISNQLISRGGIGSNHPHIEQVVSVYGINYQGEDR